MHLYSVEFQWFSKREIERNSGGGGYYDREEQEGGAALIKVLQGRNSVEQEISYSP